MGQHKRNLTSQLAKEGKLPPKERPIGKRELDRLIGQRIYDRFIKGIFPDNYMK